MKWDQHRENLEQKKPQGPDDCYCKKGEKTFQTWNEQKHI